MRGRDRSARAGGRFFGWVIGGAVPSALAADWLAAAWDQAAGLYAAGPAAAVVEEVAGAWLKDILGLPEPAELRVRHRLPDGACDVPRRGAPCRSRTPRLGRRAAGTLGRSGHPHLQQHGAPRHGRPRPPAARLRPRLRHRSPDRRAGRLTPERSKPRWPPRRRPRDRPPAGRRSQYRRVRSLRGADSDRAPPRRLGARRRRFRPLGGGQPALAASGARSRRSRLLGYRRAQVAQRALRLRLRLRRRPGAAPRRR